ncbi:MAG: glycosyltransferase [Ignavibacteriales bacterium]|nr:glycosyltransferase [Ignavibacteriales bacterium]
MDYSAAGIASILSDVEAYNSSVINEINGILVKNDTTSWIKAIEDLIINSRKREIISENAREVVLSQHSIQKNAAKWYLYYKNLISTSIENPIKISIIIPTFNSLDYTKKFIDSFYKNQLNPTDEELIIVDNNSMDDTKEYIKGLEKQKEILELFITTKILGSPKPSIKEFKQQKVNTF